MALDAFTHGFARFDGDAALREDGEFERFTRALGVSGASELLVLCHGWNNDEATAKALYDRLLSSLIVSAEARGDRALTHELAVLAVYWPSRQFDFDFEQPGTGGAATAVGPETEEDAVRILTEQLTVLESLSDSEIELAALARAKSLAASLNDLRSAQDAFVAALLPLASDPASDPGDGLPNGADRLAGRDLLDRLGRPLPPTLAPRDRELSGGTAGIRSALSGIGRGAARFLNLLTFWKMKTRAGAVGREGLAPALSALRGEQTLAPRLHLAGHSFGARLASAAVLALSDGPAHSLTVLQGAFSHHGFAEDFNGSRDGAFRGVISNAKVVGPILATHTRNDRAVGLAYPLASRLSRDDASQLGGPGDAFGGIGSNGAVRTAEADDLTLPDSPGTAAALPLTDGRIHNLKADRHISDHSDVAGTAVATALHQAIRSP